VPLRRGGSLGFEIGAEHILPAGDEITAGVLALMSGALQEREMASSAAATHSPEGVSKALACNRCEKTETYLEVGLCTLNQVDP
jgi:hypothetical protein